jgi:chorismate mutase
MAEERSVSRIDELRQRIDDIDERLVELLSARASCALAIGHEKKLLGLEVYQPSREAEVIGHVQRINQGPLDNEAIKRLFERIIDEARRLERIADEKQDEQEAQSDDR